MSSKSDSVPVARITVKAQPRAKRSRIVRVDGANVTVQLAAPPVDGAANEALIELLSEALSLRKSAVRLALGQSSRSKVVEVVGLDAATVSARLAAATSS
jgi:uncharacterized protein (TIGR00251 family)